MTKKKKHIVFNSSADQLLSSLFGNQLSACNADGTFDKMGEYVARYESDFPNYNLRFQDDLKSDPILHKQIKANKFMSLEFLNE